MTSCKSEIVDPFTMCCRVALLNFKDTGSKLKIANHTIQVDEHSRIQFLWRTWYRDSKEDIWSLLPAFVRFIKLYVNYNPQHNSIKREQQHNGFVMFSESDTTDDEKISENIDETAYRNHINNMIKLICNGLKKLQQTYGKGNVVSSLQLYILMLESIIEGQQIDDIIKKIIPEHLQENECGLVAEEKLKLWTTEDIINMCKLFDDCYQAYNSNKQDWGNIFLESILKALDMRDEHFRKVIEQTNKS